MSHPLRSERAEIALETAFFLLILLGVGSLASEYGYAAFTRARVSGHVRTVLHRVTIEHRRHHADDAAAGEDSIVRAANAELLPLLKHEPGLKTFTLHSDLETISDTESAVHGRLSPRQLRVEIHGTIKSFFGSIAALPQISFVERQTRRLRTRAD